VTEHAFLPDSKRKALGLLDNAARAARDAYLLTCLRNVRPAENFRCSFSKVSADGSPTLPSSLLLRCPETDLPARVLGMFRPTDGGGIRPRRESGWLWQLPDALRKSGISKISPTGFKEYLACPFRFYFKRVLYLEEFDPRAREMDAARFGSLIHKAVEHFAKSTPDESDAGKIEASVFASLEAEAVRLFGPQPSAAVRVQLEAARVRLRAFARVQAASFADGWRIIDAERKISADGDAPLRIGGLALSAQIDRIEEHPDLGLRIVDYKTYATPKKPGQTHLGPPGANRFLPETAVSVEGKDRRWVDLQLPLYRHIAEHLFPGRPVRTAYFILPADPSQTGIAEFEMSEEVFASAIHCAGAIADLVCRGVFWPPQPPPGSWDDPFAPLFLNGTPEAGIAPETIAFLKGQP
jgi:ATP-dependent helicase/nuclease subunit B